MTALALLFTGVLRLLYYGFYWRRPSLNSNAVIDKLESFEIIICAKNEYHNLERLIPLLLDQSYSPDRITIIDDYSTDNTGILKGKYPQINWVQPTLDMPGKKYGLSQAIRQSHSEYILLTDADCMPGRDWATRMVGAAYHQDAVLGYSPYTNNGSLLDSFVSYETFHTAAQYISFCQAGSAYMGVGRNLVIRKAAFDSVNGYESHIHYPSGDDDLLIQDMARADCGITFELDSSSWVWTISPSTWSQLWRQKSRHTSAAALYDNRYQMILGSQAGLHILWVLFVIFGLFTIPKFTLIIALGYYLIWIWMMRPWLKALQYNGTIWIPLLDIGQAMWNLALGSAGLISRVKKGSNNSTW